MTPNARRDEVLARALHAAVRADRATLATLFTNDVKAWTPAQSASSMTELLGELERRDNAFSGIELDIMPLEVNGDYACAEWRVSMTHSGDLALRDGEIVPATDVRVTINGITVAEFEGDRICALRQYWDELAVYEQLGLVGDDSTE